MTENWVLLGIFLNSGKREKLHGARCGGHLSIGGVLQLEVLFVILFCNFVRT